MKQVLSIICILLLATVTAQAAKKSIELTSRAEVDVKVKNDRGEIETKRIDAAKAKVVPGDIVIFTIHYINTGAEPAGDVVVTNPVPEHTVYVDKSAEGEGTTIDFSVDDGKTYSAPEKLKVVDTSGKELPAQASDYTHIRWTLKAPLGPAAEGNVSFRAKVK